MRHPLVLVASCTLLQGCVLSYGFDYEIDPPALQPSSAAWTVQLSGSRDDVPDRIRPAGGRALASDDENIYLVGTTDEPVEGCDGFVSTDGARSSFLAAFARDTGALRWCHAVGAWSSGPALAEAAIVATAEGVLVATPSTGSAGTEHEKILVRRFSREGVSLGGFSTAEAPGRLRVSDLALLPDGTLLLAGSAESVDGAPAALPLGGACSVPCALQRPFVAALDPAGACAWAITMEGDAQGFDAALAIDVEAGQGLVTFSGHGTFTFGGVPVQVEPFANDDVSFAGLVAPFELATGTVSQVLPVGWVYLPGLAGDPGLGAVRAFAGGGGFHLTLSLLGDPFPELCPSGCPFELGSSGFNVVLGDYAGALSESARFGGPDDEAATAVADAGSGARWVAGTYTGSTELAPDQAHEPEPDLFLARVDGVVLPRLSLHSAGVVTAAGVLPVSGGVLVAGSVGGDMPTPGGDLVVPHLDDRDAFLLFVPQESP